MAQFKAITMTHSDWKKLKQANGVGSFSIPGLEVGKALDDYHAKAKPQDHLGNLKANAQASAELFAVLKKYLEKLPKDSKRKPAFDDALVKLRNTAKDNTEYFKELTGDVTKLVQALSNFREEVTQLATDFNSANYAALKKSKKLKDLWAAAEKVGAEESIRDGKQKFETSLTYCEQLKVEGDLAGLGGEGSVLREAAGEIMANLKEFLGVD